MGDEDGDFGKGGYPRNVERARRILESQKASNVTCVDSSLSEALVHIGSPQFQLPVAYHSFLGVHISYNIDSSCAHET